jgi:hypothetical protein
LIFYSNQLFPPKLSSGHRTEVLIVPAFSGVSLLSLTDKRSLKRFYENNSAHRIQNSIPLKHFNGESEYPIINPLPKVAQQQLSTGNKLQRVVLFNYRL